MLISDFYAVPTAISLVAVAGVLAVTMFASYLANQRGVSIEAAG